MAEEEDGGFVGPKEDGADENLKVVHHVLVPCGIGQSRCQRQKEEGEGEGWNIEGKF